MQVARGQGGPVRQSWLHVGSHLFAARHMAARRLLNTVANISLTACWRAGWPPWMRCRSCLPLRLRGSGA